MKHNPIVRSILNKLVFYAGLIILWQLIYMVCVTWLGVWKDYVFPSPVDVWSAFIRLMADHTLPVAIVVSLKRLLIGCTLSVCIGVLLGLLISSSRYLDENLKPLLLGLQTLPSICWLPFAILWYGLSENAIIFVIAIGSTFSIALSIDSGIRSISPIYIQAARTMGARGLKLYRHVIFPAALPSIVAGLKQGWSFAWRALIAGEMLSATQGIGQVLMFGRELADIPAVIVTMTVIILLGLLVDQWAFGRIERNISKRWGFHGRKV